MNRFARILYANPWLVGLAGVTLVACGQSGGGGGSGGSSGSGGTPETGGRGSGGSVVGQGGASTAASAGGSPAASGGALAGGGSMVNGGAKGGAGNGGAMVASGGSAAGGSGSGASTTGGSGAGGGKGAGGTTSGGPDAGAGGTSTPGGGGAVGSGGTTSSAGPDGGSVEPGTCPTPALKAGDSTKKITVGTLNREYILHVPSGYAGDKAVPLVIDFHPIGGSDTSWRSGSPYPAVIDKEGVISAFPNGEPSPNMGNAWNVEGCCTSKINGADVDDVAFAKAVVADIEKVACIDVKRVYAVGFSMGGGMSNYLACHAADVFAAVGPASFDLTQQNEGDCKPSRPLTVIEWRGKNDTVVPYAGGHSALVTGMAIDFLGAVGTFQKWASLLGCTGNPSAADANNCQTYSQCSASVQVTLCTDNSGGHEAANANIVWPILKKYTMP